MTSDSTVGTVGMCQLRRSVASPADAIIITHSAGHWLQLSNLRIEILLLVLRIVALHKVAGIADCGRLICTHIITTKFVVTIILVQSYFLARQSVWLMHIAAMLRVETLQLRRPIATVRLVIAAGAASGRAESTALCAWAH